MTTEFQHPDDCKHLDLIVQRNYGWRWVTCTVCLSDFIRDDEVDAASAEAARYRAALTWIAARPCGIPGHAVAVGCGASSIARAALRSALDGEGQP